MERRGFLKLAAGAASIATLAACGSAAQTASPAAASPAASGAGAAGAKQADVAILNGAIDIEHQVIWTYNAAAGTKLLQKPVLDVALLFKSQHEQHRDALADAVTKLGSTPVQSKPQYELPDLKNQNDILAFALKLEDTTTTTNGWTARATRCG